MNAYNTAELSRKVDSLERRLEASENRERKLFEVLLKFARILRVEQHPPSSNNHYKFVDELLECDPDT